MPIWLATNWQQKRSSTKTKHHTYTRKLLRKLEFYLENLAAVFNCDSRTAVHQGGYHIISTFLQEIAPFTTDRPQKDWTDLSIAQCNPLNVSVYLKCQQKANIICITKWLWHVCSEIAASYVTLMSIKFPIYMLNMPIPHFTHVLRILSSRVNEKLRLFKPHNDFKKLITFKRQAAKPLRDRETKKKVKS